MWTCLQDVPKQIECIPIRIIEAVSVNFHEFIIIEEMCDCLFSCLSWLQILKTLYKLIQVQVHIQSSTILMTIVSTSQRSWRSWWCIFWTMVEECWCQSEDNWIWGHTMNRLEWADRSYKQHLWVCTPCQHQHCYHHSHTSASHTHQHQYQHPQHQHHPTSVWCARQHKQHDPMPANIDTSTISTDAAMHQCAAPSTRTVMGKPNANIDSQVNAGVSMLPCHNTVRMVDTPPPSWLCSTSGW